MQIGLPLKRWVESDYVRIGGKQSLSLFRSIFSRIRRACISNRDSAFVITNSSRWKARVRDTLSLLHLRASNRRLLNIVKSME